MNLRKLSFAASALLLSTGCTFIMGKPRPLVESDPSPQEVLSPVVIYMPICDYQKEMSGVGLVGARTAYPAVYAGEAVCNALRAELPGALNAAGIKAKVIERKYNPSAAKPQGMKEDAAGVGARYAVVLGAPHGSDGFGQTQPSVGMMFRLYVAETGEYRGYGEEDYWISLRDYSNRGPNASARTIGANLAKTVAQTMQKRCTEDYQRRCANLIRFSEPRDVYGK